MKSYTVTLPLPLPFFTRSSSKPLRDTALIYCLAGDGQTYCV